MSANGRNSPSRLWRNRSPSGFFLQQAVNCDGVTPKYHLLAKDLWEEAPMVSSTAIDCLTPRPTGDRLHTTCLSIRAVSSEHRRERISHPFTREQGLKSRVRLWIGQIVCSHLASFQDKEAPRRRIIFSYIYTY